MFKTLELKAVIIMPSRDEASDMNWIKIVILLCNGWLVIWIYRTMLSPILTELQVTIGAQSEAKMGLISSCYFLAYTFMQIPAGMLMDRIGKKIVLIPGFLLFLVGIMLVGSSREISTIYVGSVLAGIGTGAYYSGAFSIVAEQIPNKRRFISTAIVNNGCAIGMIIGVLSASFLVKSGLISWQILFYIVAGLVGLMTIAMMLLLKNDRPKELPQVSQKSKMSAFSLKQMFSPLFHAPLVSSYFLFFSTSYGYYVIVTWLPSFLEQEKGITGPATGMMTSIMALASIPGALFFGRLADQFQKKRIVFLTVLQISSALMLLFAAKSCSVIPLVICMSIYGLTGKQAIDPLILPFVTQLNHPKSLSTGLSVFNFFGMSSSIFAPVITGVICDSLGSKMPGFYLATLLLLISAAIFWKVNRKR